MIIKAEPARLRRTEWWECVLRFAFGGIVTVLTGLIAKEFGAVVGGLFLAFPGIFPAGITLIERHEKKKKRDKGLRGERRGRSVSAVVAAGAVAGSIGLVAFGALVWCALPRLAEWQALLAAMIAWLAVSLLAWFIRFRL